jgi:hypothetical protein
MNILQVEVGAKRKEVQFVVVFWVLIDVVKLGTWLAAH